MEKIYLFGRFFLLISGIKEVGVFDNCVLGVDEDVFDKIVFEVWEVIENILGFVLLFVDFVVNVWVFEFILLDWVCEVELRGLYGKFVLVFDERDIVIEFW